MPFTSTVPRDAAHILSIIAMLAPILLSATLITAFPRGVYGQVPWQAIVPAVREENEDSVFQVWPGRNLAVWIPTPSALELMGYSRKGVQVVSKGKLNNVRRYYLPSLSPTPISLVYHPVRNVFEALYDVVPNAPHLMIDGVHGLFWEQNGWDLQHVELQGWIRNFSCGADLKEFNWGFELDPDWALRSGIDLNRIIRVGNIIHPIGSIFHQKIGPAPGQHVERMAVAIPVIKLELDGWPKAERVTGGERAEKPPDWNGKTDECPQVTFPWDPVAPTGKKLPPLGLYVKVAGPLITDHNHCLPEHGVKCSDWSPGVNYRNASHNDRWTEIHPVNLIQLTRPPGHGERTGAGVVIQEAPRQTAFGVAVLASHDGPCQNLETDLVPEAPRPEKHKVAWALQLGPETIFPNGENAENGHWETLFEDHLRVRVRMCGGSLDSLHLFRNPGRFKAIYRLWWVPKPAPPKQMVLEVQDQKPAKTPPAALGKVTVTARDAVTGTVLTGAVKVVSTNGSTHQGQTGVPLSYTCVDKDADGKPVRDYSCTGEVWVSGYKTQTFHVNKPGA
jgi:hypothetical protein